MFWNQIRLTCIWFGLSFSTPLNQSLNVREREGGGATKDGGLLPSGATEHMHKKTPHRNSHLANSLHFPNEHQDIVVSLLCLSLSVWSPRICVCVCVSVPPLSAPSVQRHQSNCQSRALCNINGRLSLSEGCAPTTWHYMSVNQFSPHL